MTKARLSRRFLNDAQESFEVLLLEPAKPRATVLFAVGAGGDPDRHLPLLQVLAAQGCTVAAPRFSRLASPAPSAEELSTRARRLRLAFAHVARPDISGSGVGHSIGAALLLMLAGAKASTLAGETVRVPPERKLERLALMAPATDFFRAPGALQDVAASIVAWVGARDEITPPKTAKVLEEALRDTSPVHVRIVPDAGHFSFMNAAPPQAMEPMSLRDIFLERLAEDIASFITS
jgi:pimeloyl-ACP methyl ester carboxylesterase